MVYRKVDGRDKTEYHIPLTSGEKRLCCDDRSWMVFHLLEDAEECDEEIKAIHHEADAHQTDERNLVVAEEVANAALRSVYAVR